MQLVELALFVSGGLTFAFGFVLWWVPFGLITCYLDVCEVCLSILLVMEFCA